MTQKEKAKAYDEALKRAKDMLSYKEVRQEDIEYLFPELKESEDERIRKELIAYHRSMAVAMNGNRPCVHEAWIDWLEEQGDKPQGKTALEAIKEKPADNANKVEPKFKVGDWVVWENQYYKVNYNGCGYELVGQNGLNTSLEYGTVDENAHHWDIAKDAKEGDVLVSDNIVFIFNKIHDVWINCHCSLFKDDSFYGGDFDLMHIRYGKEVFPATKEQSDLLFQKMKEKGYEWDVENKELKKIEPKFKVKYAGREYNVLEIKEIAGVKFYGIEDEPNHIDYVFSDDCEIISDYGVKKKGSPYPTKSAIFSEQNSVWSEEDERIRKTSISFLKHYADKGYENAVECIDWLKSLKQRIGG